MYVAICDNDEACLRNIEDYMGKLSDFYGELKWETFGSAEDAWEYYKCNGNVFDILITDIEMGEMSGIDLANSVREIDKRVIIFYITSYTEYAVQCFKAQPLNFWVKPVPYDAVEADFKAAYERIEQFERHITITEDYFPVKIKLGDIICVEKQGRKVKICTTSGTHTTNISIAKMQDILPGDIFVRVYTSYIVNLKFIGKISDREVCLKTMSAPIPVSRNYAGSLRKSYMAYKERSMLRR